MGTVAAYLNVEESRQGAEQIRFFGNEFLRAGGGRKACFHQAGKEEKVSFAVRREAQPPGPEITGRNLGLYIEGIYVFLDNVKKRVPFNRPIVVFGQLSQNPRRLWSDDFRRETVWPTIGIGVFRRVTRVPFRKGSCQ